MNINITELIPTTIDGVAVADAVEGLVVNTLFMNDYRKGVVTDVDEIVLEGAGAQGKESLEIRIDVSGSNIALDEVGSDVGSLAFVRFTAITKNGKAPSVLNVCLSNIAYILNRRTADGEADVFVYRRVGGGRRVVDHWIVDVSGEALAATLAKGSTASNTIT